MDDKEFMDFHSEFMRRMQEEINRGLVETVLEIYEQQTEDNIAPKVIKGLMDNGCPPSAIIKTFQEVTGGLGNG